MSPEEAYARALEEAEYEDMDSLKAAAEILQRTETEHEADTIARRLAVFCQREA